MIRRSVVRSSFATLVMLLPAWTSACAHSPAPDGAASASAASPTSSPTSSANASASTSATPAEATPSLDAAPSAAVASSATPTPAAEPPLEGLEFLPEARVLFRVAACGQSGEMPARFDAAVVTRHCEELGHAYTEYEKSWVDLAKPFLAALRPKDLPRVVVYPFGGGDLVTALTTFPDSSEITTVSLEPAGDIRPMDKLPGIAWPTSSPSTGRTWSGSSRRRIRGPTTSRRSRRPSFPVRCCSPSPRWSSTGTSR